MTVRARISQRRSFLTCLAPAHASTQISTSMATVAGRSKVSPAKVSMLLLWLSASCASVGPTVPQDTAREVVMAPGESLPIREFDLTLTFEGVLEDSRCPTGVDCIREGDAIVRIRVAERNASPGTYTLHTSSAFAQEIEHGQVRVRLVAVTPHPAAGTTLRPQDYRATFSIRRK